MKTHAPRLGFVRPAILLGLVSAVLPIIMTTGTARAGAKLQKDERRTVDADGAHTLVVRNGRGQTVVVGKADLTQVTIVADMFVRASDKDTARRLMSELDFDVTNADGQIIVETNRPDQTRERKGLLAILRGGDDAYIDYTIEVPRSFGAVTWSTSGDVRLSNLDGGVEVHATSGDVSLREIVGATRVELTSGTIEAKGIGGDLRVLASSGDVVVDRVGGGFVMQATSADVAAHQVSGDCQIQLITGDLRLDGCLGNVHFQTSTGDAEIVNVDGSVNAITASGGLHVMIVPVGDKEFVLSSSSGDIDVSYKMPPDYGFLLDVATGTGGIVGDMAIKVEEINRRRLKGIVGTGKSRVIIETASGDVTINEIK